MADLKKLYVLDMVGTAQPANDLPAKKGRPDDLSLEVAPAAFPSSGSYFVSMGASAQTHVVHRLQKPMAGC